MKKTICFLVALTMTLSVVSLLALTPWAASDGTVNLLDMEDIVPANFNKSGADDPYGYGKGNPFLLSEQNELFTWISENRDVNGKRDLAIYDNLKSTTSNTGVVLDCFKDKTVINDNPTDSNDTKAVETYSIVNRLSHINGIAFDPNGSGRKDHIAVVGVYTNKCVYVAVYDTVRQRWCDYQELGAETWVGHGTEYYKAIVHLDITAGDYDGDNRDTVVVYASLDRARNSDKNDSQSYGIFELRFDSSADRIEPVLGSGRWNASHELLNKYYVDTPGIASGSNNEAGRRYPVVTLETGDINGDGIDDLAVLSYVFDIGDDHGSFNPEYVMPYLGVAYGVRKAQTIVHTDCGSYIHDGYHTMRAADMTVADVDGQGGDEIIIAGKGMDYTVKGDGNPHIKSTSENDNMSVSKYAFSNGQLRGVYFLADSGYDLNGFTLAGINGGGSTGQISVEGVYMNGKGNPAYIFVGGDLYDFSSDSVPTEIFDFRQLNEKDGAVNFLVISVNFICSAVTGNFDNNDSGFEQVIFVLGRKENNQGDFCFSLGMIGINSSKRDSFGLPKKDSNGNPAPEDFYFTDDIESGIITYNKGDDLEQGLNCLLITVDSDDDGLLAKYNSKSYTYADPEVLAVLQAAPRYDELEDYYYDGFSTSYSISETVSYSKGNSNSVSFGVGGSVSMKGTVGGVDLQAGYSLDWSESFEKTTSYTVTEKFSAQAEDSVVLYRTPIFLYNYDTYNRTTHEWEENALTIATANKPVYQQLSIEDYNKFVSQYNKRFTDGGISDYTPMTELKTEGLFLGIAGDPCSYPIYGVSGVSTYGNAHNLGYNSSSEEVTYSYETEDSHTVEMAHGFSFEMSVYFGFDGGFVEANAGAYVSLEYLRGSSTTYSSGDGIEIGGNVQNLMKSLMLNDGFTEEQIQKYSFSWYLAQWPSNIPTDKEDSFVPVVGFALSNVSSLVLPVYNLKLIYDDSTQKISLNWECGDIKDFNRPQTSGYNVYILEPNGSYKLVKTISGKTNTSFEYRTSSDGREYYEFGIRPFSQDVTNEGKMVSENYELNSPSGSIQKIEKTGSKDLTDIYTITLDNGNTYTFEVTNGTGISSVKLDSSDSANGIDTYKIIFTNGTSTTFTVHNGLKGDKGDKGDIGATGQNGLNGKDGIDGKDGTDGRNGKNGLNGTDGKDGLNGQDGINGLNGADGKDGISVTNVSIDENGNFIFTMSDGSVINAGASVNEEQEKLIAELQNKVASLENGQTRAISEGAPASNIVAYIALALAAVSVGFAVFFKKKS